MFCKKKKIIFLCSQTPARKTDQELKEEEELQLALALSQSEAEIKSKKVTNGNFKSFLLTSYIFIPLFI